MTPPPTKDQPSYGELLVSRAVAGLKQRDMRAAVAVLRDPEVRAELLAIVREALAEDDPGAGADGAAEKRRTVATKGATRRKRAPRK